MSVREAQRKIDSAEFSEWVAYHKIDPFTFDKSEYQLALIAAILMNVHKGKGSKTFRPEDFIFNSEPKAKDTAQDIEMKLKAIFHVNN